MNQYLHCRVCHAGVERAVRKRVRKQDTGMLNRQDLRQELALRPSLDGAEGGDARVLCGHQHDHALQDERYRREHRHGELSLAWGLDLFLWNGTKAQSGHCGCTRNCGTVHDVLLIVGCRTDASADVSAIFQVLSFKVVE